MDRALREFRIRGVATNLTFLEAIISHPKFKDNTYTTRFIDTTPELFQQVKRQDRASKCSPISPMSPSMDIPKPRVAQSRNADAAKSVIPRIKGEIVDGTKQNLDALGPKKFAEWARAKKRVLLTDTTMRDGHQSLLATRVRTYDIAHIAGTLCPRLAEPVFTRMLGRRDL